MGDMADDMMDGSSCSECGVYFEEDCGYPVVCRSCWRELVRDVKSGKIKDTPEEVYRDKKGVIYLINGIQESPYKEV